MDATSSPTLPQQSFKDRKVWLVVFGVGTILLGCGCLLLALAAAVAPFIPPPHTAAPTTQPTPGAMGLAVVFYAALAVLLGWLGVGSILARRWARTLLAIFSWSTFGFGLMSAVMMAFLAPRLAAAVQAAQPPGQPELPPAAKTMIMLIPLITGGCMTVILPLVWALFYSRPSVKATCETYDPVTRWTDRCPTPVLGLSLWLVFGAAAIAAAVVLSPVRPVIPFFGLFITGLAAIVGYLLLAAFWVGGAWLVYRVDVRGWWMICVALALFSISAFLTYSRGDMTELYRAAGYSSVQLAQVQALGLGSASLMKWASVVFAVPLLGYLLFVRRYFRGIPEREQK